MTVNIDIETDVDMKLKKTCREIIETMVNAALDFESCPYEAEVNVLITDNEGIKNINMETRGIDAPTDVLSFPMVEYEEPSSFDWLEEFGAEYFDPDSGELVLGDIVISAEKVLSQAAEYGHSTDRELAFLTVHSMLHLCGYDHMEDDERLCMEERQKNILEENGYTRA